MDVCTAYGENDAFAVSTADEVDDIALDAVLPDAFVSFNPQLLVCTRSSCNDYALLPRAHSLKR